MADTDRTVEICLALQLDSLPTAWVEQQWQQDFMTLDAGSPECEQVLSNIDDLPARLADFQNVLEAWQAVDNQNEKGEGLWSVLMENEIPLKSLLALLGYLTHQAGKVSASFRERSSGILSASIYLKLIVMPGSSAFKVFSHELLLQSCRLLNKWKKSGCEITITKSKKVTSSQSSQSQRGKGRGKKRGRVTDEDLFASQEEEQEMEVEVCEEEIEQLDQLYLALIKDVVTICEKFSLRQTESTAVQMVSILVALTRIDPASCTEEFGQWNGRRCSVGILAYKALFLLCQPFQGHVTALSTEVSRRLLDHILMIEDGKLFATLSGPILMKKQALRFIGYLLRELGERFLPNIKVLIQQLCVRVPDKTDYRAHAGESVCELLDLLPDAQFAAMMEWLKRVSKTKEVAQRSFTLDVIALLLSRPERKLSSDVPEDIAEFATHKSMVCTMLSRCSDSNASVRARALTGFSVIMNSEHAEVLRTVKDVITPITTQGRPTAKHFVPTPCMNLRQLAEIDSDIIVPSPSRAESTNKSKAPDAKGDNTEGQDGEKDQDTIEEQQAAGTHNITPGRQGEVTGKENVTPDGNGGSKSFCNIDLTPGFNPYLPDKDGVVSMFHRRVCDPKVVVRKSAIQAIQSTIQLEAPMYRTQDLDILESRCRDPALSVRKQAIQSLCELLQAFPTDTSIHKAWVNGLLPQVTDRETSVQEKCFELLAEMILLKLQPANKTSDTDMSWSLLTVIAEAKNENLKRFLHRACQHWSRTKQIKQPMVTSVESHVGGDNDKAAWMLLSEMAKASVKINLELVSKHWMDLKLQDLHGLDCRKWMHVLSVIGCKAKSMTEDMKKILIEDLKRRLHQFCYPTLLISGMVRATTQLYVGLPANQSRQFGKSLLTACDTFMSNVILSAETEQEAQVEEERLIPYMFTLGEVAQSCPSAMPERAGMLIQSIIAAPCLTSDSVSTSTHSSQPDTQANTNHTSTVSVGHSSDNTHPPEPTGTQASVDGSQQSHSSQKSTNSSQPLSQQALSQFRGSKMSPKLRAHAFITLGKLCLVDESLARKTVPALARELEISEVPAIRNNVIIVLADLIVRYTTLVDRYMTNMAACLKDPSALVRKNTLTVLTQLLQEDYVKWKGVLFFRYITALLDETKEIKKLAEMSLEQVLLVKQPDMIFHAFVECIFHFNNYLDHQTYNKFPQTEREMNKFTLAGEINASRRLYLYQFMLEHMADENKFKITEKLNKEVLSAVVDQQLLLEGQGKAILKDTLAILSSKEIKLTCLKGRPADDGGEEGPMTDVAQVVTATAKKAFAAQVVKRNVKEYVVPTVISLKKMLEKQRSPLLKDLMAYLRELMKDYKTEIKDILAADKQLAKEIEFDLRNYEANLASQAVATPDNVKTTSRPVTPANVAAIVASRVGSRAASPAPSTATTASAPAVSSDQGSPVPSNQARSPASSHNSPQPNRAVRSAMTPERVQTATRHALSRLDQLRNSPNSPFSKSVSRTPANRKKHGPSRAISTPSGLLSNITFAQDANLTLCPPSPILTEQINGSAHLALSPSVHVERIGERTVIHMPHPDNQEQGRAKWNIESPSKPRVKREPAESTIDTTPRRKSQMEPRSGTRRSGRLRSKLD